MDLVDPRKNLNETRPAANHPSGTSSERVQQNETMVIRSAERAGSHRPRKHHLEGAVAVRPERRKNERFVFNAGLELRAEHLASRMPARGHDVSAAGLSFTTSAALAIGDRVTVGLMSGEASGYALDATVRYVRMVDGAYFVGVEREED
jgi:hypothetical protein